MWWKVTSRKKYPFNLAQCINKLLLMTVPIIIIRLHVQSEVVGCWVRGVPMFVFLFPTKRTGWSLIREWQRNLLNSRLESWIDWLLIIIQSTFMSETVWTSKKHVTSKRPTHRASPHLVLPVRETWLAFTITTLEQSIYHQMRMATYMLVAIIILVDYHHVIIYH